MPYDALRYDLVIVGSDMELIHGMSHAIKEIYIPSEDIVVNLGDGDLHVFKEKQKKKRWESGKNVEHIKVPASLIISLRQHILVEDRIRHRLVGLITEDD